jgi:hypothetical protein
MRSRISDITHRYPCQSYTPAHAAVIRLEAMGRCVEIIQYRSEPDPRPIATAPSQWGLGGVIQEYSMAEKDHAKPKMIVKLIISGSENVKT